MDGHAGFETLMGHGRKGCGFVHLRPAFAGGKARQDRFLGARAHMAAHGDFNTVRDRLWQVSKQINHLRACFKVMLETDTTALVIRNNTPFSNRQQCIMGLIVGGLGKERLVGGHQG